MKILIGTPAYDGKVFIEYHQSIMRLAAHIGRNRPGVSMTTQTLVSMTIAHARNAFATAILTEPGFTHLLFIDADMGFAPSLVDKMLEADKPLVGVVSPAKAYDFRRLLQSAADYADPSVWMSAMHRYIGGDNYLLLAPDGKPEVRGSLVRASRAGAGIMLIRRDVLERLSEAHPDLWGAYPERGGPFGLSRIFQPFTESLRSQSGLVLSEDLAFCRRWIDLGGEIWSVFDETIEHVGRHVFTGNYVLAMARDVQNPGPTA